MRNAKLVRYLERTSKLELKTMHSYDIDDPRFGVPTAKYDWCQLILNGQEPLEELITYFERYSIDEDFVEKIKMLVEEFESKIKYKKYSKEENKIC